MAWFKNKNAVEIEKEVKDMTDVEKTDLIKTDKIEVTVPKVVGVVAKLRADKAGLEKLVADMLADAVVAQAKIDELEAILASLLNEGGESAGDVV